MYIFSLAFNKPNNYLFTMAVLLLFKELNDEIRVAYQLKKNTIMDFGLQTKSYTQ